MRSVLFQLDFLSSDKFDMFLLYTLQFYSFFYQKLSWFHIVYWKLTKVTFPL